MNIVGDYEKEGYVHIRALVSEEVAQAFLQALKRQIGDGPIMLSGKRDHVNLLHRPAFEIYGHHYPPMLHFLWGLTPTVSAIVGRELLPTYDYFRIYREGDRCRVHYDRPSCEHSLSLTLDYSDGVAWPLELGRTLYPEPSSRVEEDFGDEAYGSIAMEVGDAVLYRGVQHRHGRITPNPNGWSAHLFLHWVEREGAYRDHGFDGHRNTAKVNFSFS